MHLLCKERTGRCGVFAHICPFPALSGHFWPAIDPRCSNCSGPGVDAGTDVDGVDAGAGMDGVGVGPGVDAGTGVDGVPVGVAGTGVDGTRIGCRYSWSGRSSAGTGSIHAIWYLHPFHQL